MSSDLVLDLDDDDPDADRVPAPVWWRAVRVPFWVVVSLVLVVAVVAVSATRIWDARARAVEQKAVTVLVHIPADSGLVGRREGSALTLAGAVQVINTGQLQIALETVMTTTAGVSLRGDGDGRVIPAGTAGQVIVYGSIDCGTWAPTEPIQMHLDLRDRDGDLHGLVETVFIQGAWDELLATCDPKAP